MSCCPRRPAALGFAILTAASLAGCGREEKAPIKRKAGQFSEASKSNGMLHQVESRGVAGERMLQAEATRALQAFQAQFGRNPVDLEELNAKVSPGLKPLDPPRRYVYDPDAGTITVE